MIKASFSESLDPEAKMPRDKVGSVFAGSVAFDLVCGMHGLSGV